MSDKSKNNSEVIPFDNLEAICTESKKKATTVSSYIRVVSKHYRKHPQRIHVQPDEEGKFATVIRGCRFQIIVDGWVTKDAKKKK